MYSPIVRSISASSLAMSGFKDRIDSPDTDEDGDETEEQKFDRIEGLVLVYVRDALEYSRTVVAGDDPGVDAEVVYYVRRECFDARGEYVRPCRTHLRGVAVTVRKLKGVPPPRPPYQ